MSEHCLPLLRRIIRRAGNTPQCRGMQPSALVIKLKNKMQTFKALQTCWKLPYRFGELSRDAGVAAGQGVGAAGVLS